MALTLENLLQQANYDFSHGNPEDRDAFLLRTLGATTAYIEAKTNSDIPDDVKDAAVLRMIGYLAEMPASPAQDRYMAIWRYSGAASLCGPWTKRVTGITEEATA